MSGPLADVDIAILLAFGGGALVAVWSAVIVAGFLPRRAGPRAGSGAVGALMIYGSAAMVLAVVCLLALTAPLLPAAVAVIAAGLAVLAGPFLAEPIPRHLRESRLALGLVAVLSLAALLALPRPF